MVLLAWTWLALAAAESFRPQFHFSPQQNWTNDPSGLVYFDGEYHLFFQHNPFGDQWGHMSWGHAVSRDLVRWEQLPVALGEERGVMVFTGSAVVDRGTSGLCDGGRPCLVAIYTGHTPHPDRNRRRETQNLAFSHDRGRSWTRYSGNPVLDPGLPDFRDPKVFWREKEKRWVMAVALPRERQVRLFASPDLKTWEKLSDFGPAGATGGAWECPDLFELPVDGNAANTRWVLKVGLNPGHLSGGSGEQYFLGRFDGTTFHNDNIPARTLWLDYGPDCYCALTWNEAPQPVLLGWMSNWLYARFTPTRPWRGQMTIPRALALQTFPDGLRLTQKPIAALQSRREKPVDPSSARTFELQTTIRPGHATEVGWRLLAGEFQETLVGYDTRTGQIFLDRTKSGQVAFSPQFPRRYRALLPLANGELKLRIFVDRSSVEVFAGDGRVVFTALVFPNDANTAVEFYSQGGAPGPVTSTLWPLQ